MEKNLDEEFMRVALTEAEKANEEGNWPMGCVIVVDGQIIAQAHNTSYTHKNRLAHAELQALVAAKDILENHRGKATLYTTYEPCPMCLGALVMMKISRVVTGVDLDKSGSLDLQGYLPAYFQQEKFKFSITRGVLAEDCRRVFENSHIGSKHLEKLRNSV